jgi:predicted transcriptional regulator of viral defense system
MGRPNRFQIMELYKKEILNVLESQDKFVFKEEELAGFLETHKEEWKLPKTTTTYDFYTFLYKSKILTEIELEFPQKTTTRFVIRNKEINIFELGCSLAKNAYISHYTAAFYHDLTNNIVKSIYVNQEQKPKNNEPGELDQESIDYAFSRPMRTSNNYTIFQGRKFYILTGRYSNNVGIFSEKGVRYSNIERTLIDIAVRPGYSGGTYEVLEIYKNAKGVASVNKMYSYLKKLNYVYPYHQTIGFYLEKAGYNEAALKLMEKFPITHNFYLTYEMKKTSFSERWKIFYPMEMDS